MTNDLEYIYEKAAGRDQQALQFLHAWNLYCHRIDDFLDEEKRSPEELVGILVDANVLYTLPFFRAHAMELYPVVSLITRTYGDSIWLSSSMDGWKKQAGNVLRFVGNDMVKIVAQLTGGYDLAREVSGHLIMLSHEEHTDDKGNPT